LQGLGRLDEATHKAALLAHDPGLRRNAIRALGADEKAHALFFGSGVISDPDLTTRLAAFVKLAEFPTTEEVRTLVKKLNGDPIVKNDEWLHEAGALLAKKHKALNYKEGPNLLPNPGFELLGADGLPEGWKRRDYGRQPGNAAAEWTVLSGAGNVHSGEHSVRCITRDNADTSLFATVPVKPHTDYKLSAWVRAHALKGKVSLNDHYGRAETEKVTRDTKGQWQEVEVIFNSKEKAEASINLLHVAKGDGYFDDVKLCELIMEDDADKVVAGDPKRGENIFWHHPIAACMNCHMLGGKGSTVGPPLDGIAGRQTEAYITQSLLEPNAVLAKGYEYLKISPMPPMGLILKPQELADVKAFILTLKEQPQQVSK
jgi:mono/diheme cytochrome c family protein